jgi:AcrR family transcriptional regulator
VGASGTAGSIFGAPPELPRGPHGLTREEVAGAQRARLLQAVTDVVAEKGYARATIAEIARSARVSPNVFYEHFAGKEACYLAAYDVFAQTLLQRIAGDIPPGTSLEEFIAVALDAYLGTLEAEPAAARAFVLEMDSAGQPARERRHAAYAAIAGALQQRHEELRRTERLDPLPDLAFMAIVHGVRELACDVLEGRVQRSLTDIAPDIRQWLTATFARRTA